RDAGAPPARRCGRPLRRASRCPPRARPPPRGRPGSGAGAAPAAAPRSRPAPAASSAAPSFELLEEAQIVGVEEADILDAVLDHGDPLDAHAPGETRQARRVVAHPLEHARVDHAGTENLEPARAVADRAARVGSVTAIARDGEVDPRLDEREVVAPKPCPRPRPEHPP